jgi:branched-chain amino acid transport system substrate-binding protein
LNIRIKSGAVLTAAAAAAVLTLTSCSSSGGTDNAKGSSPAPSGGASQPASKSTIVLGSMSSLTNPAYSTPQVRDGIAAAIGSINAAGGVDGHQLKLDFCDTAFDPNKELSCARKLIADKVDAFINPAVLADPSGQEYTAIKAAKIPVIGTEGQSPPELNNSIVFPLSSGIPGWVYGSVDSLVQNGAKKISLFLAGGPTGDFLGGLASAALKSAGMTAVRTVNEDAKADPTFDASAAKVTAGGVDGIVLLVSPVNIPTAVAALKNAGYTGKISSITALFAPALLKAVGDKGNGILLASQLAFDSDTSNPAIVQFRADLAKYAPKAIIDETTLFSWSATRLFAKVAGTGKASTSAEILAAFDGLAAPVDIGTAAPYATTGTSPLSDYARILNPTAQYGAIQDGKLVPNGKGFVNPFTDLSQVKTG